MKLTRTERWILSNQLQILALLDPDKSLMYEQSQKIIENGYEFLYESCIEYVIPDDDTISKHESREVLDILSMFRAIINSVNLLDDTSDIETDRLKFEGFDGNNEAKYLDFAEFFCTEFNGGRFQDVIDGLNSFNTHYPILDSYKRMLEEWNKCKDKNKITKTELIRIAEASVHPENR